MECLFNKNFGDIENWDQIYTSYIDLSGLGEQGQLATHVAIHNLNIRLKHISDFLEFQTKVYKLIKMPHIPTINDMRPYGHRLTWDPQNDTFIDQLNMIEAKEKRNYVEMKKLQKELKQMQDAMVPTTISARNSFVLMLNMH